jgi:hypothetical protein
MRSIGLAVVVSAVGLVGCGGQTEVPRPHGALLRRAQHLCDRYQRDHEIGFADPVSYSPATAGAVAQLGDVQDIDVGPWDRLPRGHFVAVCTYTAQPVEVNTTNPTTVCPNGDVVLTDSPKHTSVIVDEHGRSSETFLEAFPIQIPLC